MKKIICSILSALTVLLPCTAAFAAEVSVTKAEQNMTDNKITVECTLSDASVGENITVLACEYNDATYSKDIIYIDQFNASVTDNKFSFAFAPASWTDTAKTYIVRVGGADIDTPEYRIIAFYGVKVFSAGDINGDKVVDEADASLLLRYLSDLENLTDEQLEAANVHTDATEGIVDMLDVVEILNKK